MSVNDLARARAVAERHRARQRIALFRSRLGFHRIEQAADADNESEQTCKEKETIQPGIDRIKVREDQTDTDSENSSSVNNPVDNGSFLDRFRDKH